MKTVEIVAKENSLVEPEVVIAGSMTVIRKGVHLHDFTDEERTLIEEIFEGVQCAICVLKKEYQDYEILLMINFVLLDLVAIVELINNNPQIRNKGFSFSIIRTNAGKDIRNSVSSVALGVGKYKNMRTFAYDKIPLSI